MLRLDTLLSLFWMSFASSLMACPGCKEPSNVAGASGVSGISAGFSWSVLFMLSAVATVLGGMILMFVRSCRRIEAGRQIAAVRAN